MLVRCSADDCDALAVMNKQLIEDEGSDNPMDSDALARRMRAFLGSGFAAYFCMAEEAVAGYALVNTAADPVYLRQFFICRQHRRKGLGRAFFFELMDALGAERIDIDVLAWNEAGVSFWESLGFAPRSIRMRYSRTE